MDYELAAPIAEALRNFLEKTNLGYYGRPDRF
jgi:bifunctional pyridoxal-dependent enzyme with beta-cystathionase and maltose regulon repressor activities